MDPREICRSCLSEDRETINLLIFHDTVNNSKLSDEFFVCTNIQVTEDDDLPQSICIACMKDLVAAYNFRLRCENSEKCLRERLYIFLNQVKDECTIITSDPTDTKIDETECLNEDNQIETFEVTSVVEALEEDINKDESNFECKVWIK